MDIGKLSMNMAQSSIKTSVNIALMVKAKEQITENTSDLMKVLETTAITPGVGGNLDVSV